jgi:hypothetical protein
MHAFAVVVEGVETVLEVRRRVKRKDEDVRC